MATPDKTLGMLGVGSYPYLHKGLKGCLHHVP